MARDTRGRPGEHGIMEAKEKVKKKKKWWGKGDMVVLLKSEQ